MPLLILFASFLENCQRDQVSKDECIILGRFTGMDGRTLYLKEVDIRQLRPIDSIRIKTNDEKFKFHLNVIEPGFYVIQIGTYDYFPLVLKRGDIIDFQADAYDVHRSYMVSGTSDNIILKHYFDFTNRNEERIQKLNQVFLKSKELPDFARIRDSINVIYETIIQDQQDSVKKIIRQNPGSLSSLFIINQKFGPQPVLNEKDHLNYFLILDSALTINYPTNKHTLDHHKRIASYKEVEMERQLILENLKIGSKAPDISLNDPQGIPHKLSDYRNKIVLLDFWAAWCAPCRKENQNLIALYEKYKNRDFEIFSVSLDNNKDLWVNVIKTDKITWIQVSDLKYPSSPIQKIYNVEEIPQSYLIDREGKIIEKNLKGKDLADKLKELFK
ncbi:MAG: TlpA disulfide reductase family protein [Bacteroidetes bacterium]|nr:TlpA disulfide reductase family protein [Bacteroidota bacterium]